MFLKDDMKKITGLTLYTGSFGKKGCTCKCEGCSQEKYGKQHGFYQGTMEQVEKILSIAPNIQRAILLGNPDISVDAEFVNRVAKYFIARGIRVRFSTSGFNAVETAQTVLADLDTEYIDYYSFSVDSLEPEKELLLKGRVIPLVEIVKAIKMCDDMGVRIKIQPTLWEINKNDYVEIIDFFYGLGVRWFSFHSGSFETFDDKKHLLKHISPWEWRDIQRDIGEICNQKRIKLHMPYLFLTEEEMKKYVESNGERCVPKQLLNTQIWLEEDYMRTTHCPLLREHQVFEYDFNTCDKSRMDYSISVDGYCPVAAQCLGKKLTERSVEKKGHMFQLSTGEKLYTVCRFYNFTVDK